MRDVRDLRDVRDMRDTRDLRDMRDIGDMNITLIPSEAESCRELDFRVALSKGLLWCKILLLK